MTASTSVPRDSGPPVDGSWPWECLDCQATIYHDGDYCRSCRPPQPTTPTPADRGGDGFRRWLRRQSYPTFLTKVTAIAGIELTLTALWLQLLADPSVMFQIAASLG